MAITTEAFTHQLQASGFEVSVSAAHGRIFATCQRGERAVELVAHRSFLHWQLYMRATGWSLTSIVRDLGALRELLDVRAPSPELVN